MRTTNKDIRNLCNSIAAILNDKNNTDIYSYNNNFGVVRRENGQGGISVIVWAQRADRETYDKLAAIQYALLELK